MTLPILYIAATNSALKLFTDLTRQRLILLDQLDRVNKPCPYSYLYSVLADRGCSVYYSYFTETLRDCVNQGYITRSTVARNVVYAITLKGKALLHSFCCELENLVKQDIAKYGNGLS